MNVAVLRLNLASTVRRSERVEAARRERGAAVAALERARIAADPVAGAPQARARLADPSDDGYIDLDEAVVRAADKQANRRIRLLLAVFALVFGGTLARAVWLQGVNAASLGRWRSASTARRCRSPRAAARSSTDRRPARDRRADDDRLRRSAAGARTPRAVARRGARAARRRRERALPAARSTRSRASSTSSGSPIPKAARASCRRASPASTPTPRSAAPIRRARSAAQVVGYAGIDNKGLAGLELEYDQQLAGRPASRRSSAIRSAARSTSISATAERAGRRRLHDDRPHDPGEGRGGAARDGRALGCEGRATAVVLDPRTGEVLAMAQAPGYNANTRERRRVALQRNRAVTDTYEPGSTFKLVTVAGGALGRARHARRRRSRCRTRSTVADRVVHDAEERGTETTDASRRSSRTRRTSAP